MFSRIEKAFLVAFCLAVIWTFTAAPGYADDWDKATKITVNQPFEIPGMVLPAGTYMVRLVDIAAERHVVRFLSEDESKVYATLIAIPNFRLEPTDATSMTFYESEVGRPRALHEWFYPGHQFGVEFVYPESNSTAIAPQPAKVSEAPKEAALTPARTKPEPAAITEQTNQPVAQFQPAVTAAKEQQPVQIAQANTQPKAAATSAAATVATQKQAPKKLPKTASSLPLLIVLGLFSLAGSAGIHAFSKQSV